MRYTCSECGHNSNRWFAQCPKCKQYETALEVADQDEKTGRSGLKSDKPVAPLKRAQTLSSLKTVELHRVETGINEFDRVLGGGFVDSEVVVIVGEPGCGKSTLSLDVASRFASKGLSTLYCSGEESEYQIALRARRMGVESESIRVTNETNLETLLGHIEIEDPDFVIVDSLQTLASSAIPSSQGSLTQSKEAAHALTRIAKTRNKKMLLVNQINKAGELAGSNSIAHIVDAVLMLESDRESPLKFLRATKNRFGETDEVGIFQHEDKGLNEVIDPSGMFLENNNGAIGTACSFLSEGIRQIPIEVQALVTESSLSNPRRQFSGVDFSRGQIVNAILDKFCSAQLFENDVYMSTVAGIRCNDPQVDLALAGALLSSVFERPLPSDWCVVGELSLTGRVRGGLMIDSKVREAERLGFSRIIVPATTKLSKQPKDIEVVKLNDVQELNNLIKKG